MNPRINTIRRTNRTRGIANLYILLLMPVLLGFASLGVDYARVQLTKSKLQDAADSAARAAASAIPSDPTAATALAIQYAGAFSVHGTAVQLLAGEVDYGTWNTTSRTFTKLTGFGAYSANAVRVTISRTAAKGNATSLQFARYIGISSIDTTVSAIAMLSGGTSVAINVPSSSDPYLAGMPPGSTASVDDVAPQNSPAQATSMAIVPGAEMSFATTGTVKNGPSYPMSQPTGNLSWTLSHLTGNENGISNVTMPIDCLLGVFLGPDQPNLTPAPAALDFSTAASRDYTSLKPLLKQPFYIGSGLNSHGQVQRFVVPAGATRLYLATMDGFEWNNDGGAFNSTVTTPRMIRIVK